MCRKNMSQKNYSHNYFICVIYILIVSLLLLEEIVAKPITTDTASPLHIINYVDRRKRQENYAEFDFEPINGTDLSSDIIPAARLKTLFDRTAIIVNEHINSDIEDRQAPAIENNESSWSELNGSVSSDDDTFDLNRVKKQGIPVLEPVKHLLNTVRDGAWNHTSSRHHLLGNHGVRIHSNTTESAAIETEEDRETVIESTSFNLLDLLGTIGGMLWNVLTNLQRVFAASSGSASAASSSSSSGGQ